MILNSVDFFKKLNNINEFKSVVDSEDISASLEIVALCLINNVSVSFGYSQNSDVYKNEIQLESHNDLLERMHNTTAMLHFQTSGTTGSPKRVDKKIGELEKGIVRSTAVKNLVWGFCYSTRHISGLYVLLQALYTESTIVDLRNLSSTNLLQTLLDNKVSHISAPTTFYQLNFPLKEKVGSITNITNGGEPFSKKVLKNIKDSCPNAKVKNIYATTEFGSLLISNNQVFSIPEKLKDVVKIENETIFVHASIVSNFKGLEVNQWYNTNDKVRLINSTDFEIIGRNTEDIKVLGHLVSLRKIESILSEYEQVKIIKVKPIPHNVFGHLLITEVVPNSEEHDFDLVKFKTFIKENLRNYERPQKIVLVKEISTTYSGKIKR